MFLTDKHRQSRACLLIIYKIIFCITYCYHVSPAPVTVYIASPSTSQELIASFFTSTQENFFGGYSAWSMQEIIT